MMGRRRIWEEFGRFIKGTPQYRKYVNDPSSLRKFKSESEMRNNLREEWPDREFKIKGYKRHDTRFIFWKWK